MKGLVGYAKAEELITADTAIVSMVLASNVTGTINDVARIIKKAKTCGAITIVDATAAAGHIPLDVLALGCDALYFSGHKMFAPTGVGVLWVRGALLAELTPSVFGGHMISRMNDGKPEWASIPSCFEAGTKNISGVIGLGAAVDYLTSISVAEVHATVAPLVAEATQRLLAIEGVVVVSERDPKKNVGIVSFVCDWAHPHDIAEVLARDRVAVRPGHHCAIPLHGALGIESSVRVSFHCYNTTADIDALSDALLKCKQIFS